MTKTEGHATQHKYSYYTCVSRSLSLPSSFLLRPAPLLLHLPRRKFFNNCRIKYISLRRLMKSRIEDQPLRPPDRNFNSSPNAMLQYYMSHSSRSQQLSFYFVLSLRVRITSIPPAFNCFRQSLPLASSHRRRPKVRSAAGGTRKKI